MSKYKTTHLPPSEIDRLRLEAFVTNSQEDLAAYYRAASLYFQERDVRAMNRAARIEELEAKLAECEARLEKVVEAVEVLNAACDAMWNDHGRIEENPQRFGQPYRLKETHIRAISEAQQKLPAILAELKGQTDE